MKKRETTQLDESYFCHIIIPSKNYKRSSFFFQRVFGWKVRQATGSSSLDILPSSGKGASAELNSEERVVVPAIHTTDIDGKLKLIEKLGGKKVKGKTPAGEGQGQGYYGLFEDPDGNRMCLYSEA